MPFKKFWSCAPSFSWVLPRADFRSYGCYIGSCHCYHPQNLTNISLWKATGKGLGSYRVPGVCWRLGSR